MTTAIAPKQSTAVSLKKTFQDWVKTPDFKDQLAAALPKHLTPDRFTRVLLTATIRNPRLLECTQESLFKTIFDCAASGLELDGRRAHAIPFRNNQKNCYECQLIVDYKGLVELAMRSGVVSSVHADTVCEDDEFEVDRGLITKHKINYRKPRGEPYAAYCMVRMHNGAEPKCEVMTRDEIERIRSRSKSANSGPWVTDEFEMWKKTVTRRTMKWVPLSPELHEAMERDADSFEPRNVTPLRPMAGLAESLAQPQHTEIAPEAPADGAPADEEPAQEAEAVPEPEKPLPSRTNVVADLETRMLAFSVPESRVWRWAQDVWPAECQAAGKLFNLPTAILVKLKDNVAAIGRPVGAEKAVQS
jgi:recombination protein RecT